MLTYEQALAIVLEHASPLETVDCPLDDLPGGVLAQPILAPHDMPLFDNSAVDGYGLHAQDVLQTAGQKPVALKLSGAIQAGDDGALSISEGSTLKLLTGAPVPVSVCAVAIQEFTQVENGTVILQKAIQIGDNIRRRGEEFTQGDEVLSANRQVTPPVMGLLASLGLTQATIYRRPKVAIIVTGNELVSPGQSLKSGQIYESNSYGLSAALKTLGCHVVLIQQVNDSLAETQDALNHALTEADIVITSGGVSVGEFDWVKKAAESLGVQSHFWKVAIKPGKPIYFGSRDQTLLFGLPGNPVAVLVTFYLFVLPALKKMQGLEPENNRSSRLLKARLLKDLSKRPERLDFVRGQLSQDESGFTVMPTTGQGSHMLGGLAMADCLLPFALEDSDLKAGTWVDVIPLNWSLFS
jgi:molybdopterin molybdotransferase